MTTHFIPAPVVDDARPASPARPAVPACTTSILLTIAVAASLAPSLLPRSPATQAIVTGVFAAAGLIVAAALRRLVRAGSVTVHPRARRVTAGVGVAAVAGGVVSAARWQNELRAAMGVQSTSTMHWVEVGCGSISVCAILVVLGVGISRAVRRLRLARTVALVAFSAVAGYAVVVPAASSAFTDHYAVANAAVDTSLSRSAHTSAAEWAALGREGRKFVTGGTDSSAIRVYVPLDAAATPTERARLAADELERSGGLTASHVVLAVPTGSGWVDENAVSGFEERFAGDVATAALQYSYQPSWATFLFAKTEARDSAVALLDAVRTRIAAMPADARPDLFVYGQSLGSVGGSAAVQSNASGVCGTLWAGPPASDVDRSGAIVLANSSDPVVRWSSALLLSPPDTDGLRPDAPAPPWFPIVSYLQTTVDLISALDAPDGHGHRYGRDQGTELPEC